MGNGQSTGAERGAILYAYAITTRKKGTAEEKSFWNRIGTAWVNRDGSLNVQLFAFPLDGKVQLRAPEEKDEGGNGA